MTNTLTIDDLVPQNIGKTFLASVSLLQKIRSLGVTPVTGSVTILSLPKESVFKQVHLPKGSEFANGITMEDHTIEVRFEEQPLALKMLVDATFHRQRYAVIHLSKKEAHELLLTKRVTSPLSETELAEVRNLLAQERLNDLLSGEQD